MTSACSHGTAFFFKKWGKFYPNGNNLLVKLTKALKDEDPRVEHVLDGREWSELPPRIRAIWRRGISFSISRRGKSAGMRPNPAVWRHPANSKFRTAHRALQ